MTEGELFYQRSSESLEGIATRDFMSLLHVKTEQAISFDSIEHRLNTGTPLNIKFGTDPTGPDLHLGHIVPIRVLDIFSRAGHNIDLIFGDFTAKVGDPTGRSEERPLLTDEKIAANMLTFRDQVDKYFDTSADNVKIHTNSTWLGKMALADVFGYLEAINLTEATQRNDFRERIQKGQAVSLAETIYGTLMGIDSVELKTDIEIGGIDQLLNFHQTRTVQRSQGQMAEDIIMTPIIEGTSGDGRKMSKSYGNYVPVRADASEVFGKIMSIPDTLIAPYIKAFAPIYSEEVPEVESKIASNPLEIKKQLATYMAGLSSGNYQFGIEAREKFEKRFSKGEIDISEATELNHKDLPIIDLLLTSGDFQSKGQLRRLAEQGGIKLNGERITSERLLEIAAPDLLITVGKRKVFVVTKAE